MRIIAASLFLTLMCGCSGDDTQQLDPTSSKSVIEKEANSITQAAEKAAALVEADANAEITAQEIQERKNTDAPVKGEQ